MKEEILKGTEGFTAYLFGSDGKVLARATFPSEDEAQEFLDKVQEKDL